MIEKGVGTSIVLLGATGMVGGLALRAALDHPGVSTVTVLGRRRTGVEHPKLNEIPNQDFTSFASLEGRLAGHDVVLYCVGAYTGTVSDEELRAVTLDYTVAFVEAFRRASPLASFCFLSGQGADPTGASRMAFARYKGAAEAALLSAGFPRVHIFRPGYIYPVEPRAEPNSTYRIMRALYPTVRRVYPNIGISSNDLATAMLRVGLYGTPGHASPILENRDIRRQAVRRP
jgi:uncharacterized protein YbjT (DUF2867 family)